MVGGLATSGRIEGTRLKWIAALFIACTVLSSDPSRACAEEGDAKRPLVEAAVRGDLQGLNRALAQGASKDGQEMLEALTAASGVGHVAIVDRLIAAGADVKQLVDAGAKIELASPEGAMPLHLAAYAGHLKVVQFLVERGADLNRTNKLGSTPIRAAAEGGHVDVVRWLLQHGARPSIRDTFGKYPIDYAREKGHAEVVKLLQVKTEHR